MVTFRSMEVIFSALAPLSRRVNIVCRTKGRHTKLLGGGTRGSRPPCPLAMSPVFQLFHGGTRHTSAVSFQGPRPRERQCAEIAKATKAPEAGDG